MSIITASREQFLSRYQKKKTKDIARTAFYNWDLFLRHLLTEEADFITRIKNSDNKKEIYYVLDHFVQFVSRKNLPSSVRTYFQFVKPWLKYCDVPVDSDLIRDHVRFPKPVRDRPRGMTREILQMLLQNCNDFYRAYILAQTSSGMREGELLSMQWDWIDFEKNPAWVMIPAKFTKAGQERLTFLSPEAIRAIKKLERKDLRVFPITTDALQSYFARLRKKCGLLSKGSNGMYHVRIHKNRAFAEYNMSRSVGKEFAKSILGHTDDLIQYFQNGGTDEDFAADYKKAVSSLELTTRL